jgi:hypothetical protein
MTNPINAIIQRKGWCVADGAAGSNFFGRGLEAVIHQNCGVSSAQMKFYGCTTSSYVPALI